MHDLRDVDHPVDIQHLLTPRTVDICPSCTAGMYITRLMDVCCDCLWVCVCLGMWLCVFAPLLVLLPWMVFLIVSVIVLGHDHTRLRLLLRIFIALAAVRNCRADVTVVRETTLLRHHVEIPLIHLCPRVRALQHPYIEPRSAHVIRNCSVGRRQCR